jgi:hypothetical protein
LIVEAKQNDFNEGWGQCLAELVASQKLDFPKQHLMALSGRIGCSED